MNSKKVLLVGWDAADWKVIHPLMDAGLMPNLARLVEGGVMADMATLRPCYSPMLWTSIATGKRASKHGVLGFSEVGVDGRTVGPVTSLSRKTKAIWNILNQSGHRSIVVGWWPSHPVEPIRGAMVSDFYHKVPRHGRAMAPLPSHSVHPVEWAAELAQLRLDPRELRLNEILPFVPRGEEVDQDKDPRLATLARLACEALNVNSAATFLMERTEWDFAAVYFDAIDHFSHGFMRYRAPRQARIKEPDFEFYKDVIDTAYRLHDLMLGALLRLTGPETTVLVISDHGFHSDHLRPPHIPREPAGPAMEHRDFGIFVARGPGLRRDQLIHGVNLLNVTPTLLTLFGLPVGGDMDGRPLVQAFEQPPVVTTIPSWDDVEGEDARHSGESRVDPLAARESLRQLVAMGYLEPLPANQERAVARTARELRFNLAQSLVDEDRHREAAAIFRELHRAEPDEFRFALHLAECALALGDAAELALVVEDLDVRRRAVARAAGGEFRQFRERVVERMKAEAAASEGATVVESDVLAPVEGEEIPGAPPEDPGEPTADDDELDGPEVAAVQPAPRSDAPPKPKRIKPTLEERVKLGELRGRARFNSFAVDYLSGQLELLRGDPRSALTRFLKAEGATKTRPGLHLLVGQAYLGLKLWEDAQRSFLVALEIDPGNPHAQLGLAQCFLRQRRIHMAAQAAIAAIAKLYRLPMAHYVLAQALARLRRPRQAVEAAERALAINAHFPEAHDLLARLYDRRLGDATKAGWHRLRAAEFRAGSPAGLASPELAVGPSRRPARKSSTGAGGRASVFPPEATAGQPVIIVAGLPRSGTSLIMQMLMAGGVPVLTDARREADADNPRGYFEFESVKRLPQEAGWLEQARGRAVKVVVPLLPSLPDSVPYRVILIDRHPAEIAASQRKMLDRVGFQGTELTPAQWECELDRQRGRAKDWLARRAHVPVLELGHAAVIADPAATAAALNRFFGGSLDEAAMSAAVDPGLHRQRTSGPGA